MYGKIVGLGSVIEGVSKKTSKAYKGQNIHFTYKKRGVDGMAVKEQFVSFLDMDKSPAFKVGQEVFLDYDDSGYLLDIEVAPEK